jgi:short-subunit dehydrogenase
MKLASLQDKVVVITGASSGIGKLAVEAFLQQGAKVMLAARSEVDMHAHVASLPQNHNTYVMVTDVSDYNQMQTLARRAVAHFGTIDIWINNAGVGLYSYVDDMDMADVRRVIDVNLMGAIHGMKAVLPIFINQQYGTIINISSVEGIASTPLLAAYAAAKHGILGFSMALREELKSRKYQHTAIDVSDILPASMDTPFGHHAKTTLGKLPKPVAPIYDPMLVVNAMVECAKQPKIQVIVGPVGQLIAAQAKWWPSSFEWLMSKIGVAGSLTAQPKHPDDSHTLYQPQPGTNQAEGHFAMTKGWVGFMKNHPIQVVAWV